MSTQFITLGVQIDQYTANTVEPFLTTNFNTFQDSNDFAINSSLIFGGEEDLSFLFTLNSIEPTTTIGEGQLNFIFTSGLLPSALVFGNLSLNRFIETESIVSTVEFGTGFGFVSLGAAPIEPGVTFGLTSFTRPFHRSLIYKNDNITKLSRGADDVEVASGIVLKASDTKLESASLPEVPAGYVVVTIDGVDYKMPFFNL